MAKQINTTIGGTVKKVSQPYAWVGGVLKKIKKGVCGVGGAVKTFFESGLVLWDGSSAQNGAYIPSGYTDRLMYTGTAGFLKGKTLVVVTKNNYSKNRMTLYESNGGGNTGLWYLNNDGAFYSYAITTSWTAGVEYSFDLNELGYESEDTQLRFMFCDSSGTGLALSSAIQQIILK